MTDLAQTKTDDDTTAALRRLSESNPRASEELFRLVYTELHRIAGRYMSRQRADHTLQPTSLVHEAYLKLVRTDAAFHDRKHFVRAAARAMRSILVDHARTKGRDRRTPPGIAVPLDGIADGYANRSGDLIALDDALVRLSEVDPELVRMVELRFFGGLTLEECADVLELSARRVDNDLKIARAWLRRALS